MISQERITLEFPGGCIQVRLAITLAQRLRGWLGVRDAAHDEGLWIKPCNAIHTVGMRFPIDAVFLDASGRVLRVHRHVSPWRVRWVPSARSVIELRSGAALRIGIRVGIRLGFGRFSR